VYPASAILRAGGIDPVMAATRIGLLELDRVPVRPAPRWLRAVWSGPIAAMTMPWAIYVDPRVLTGDAGVMAPLLFHELVHVRQWRTFGVFGFLRRYLADYLSARLHGLAHYRAYLEIGFEREARELAGH
jgi:hypothetical protein